MVVILSWHKDVHMSFVTRHLTVPYVVIDAADILAGKEFSIRIHNDHSTFTVDGHAIRDVTAVWNRRLAYFRPEDLPVADHFKEYSQRTLARFKDFLYSRFPEAFWLPDPFQERRAEDKMWQLECAARAGLRVPDTMVTTSEAVARDFLRSQEAAVAKPIDAGYYEKGGKAYGFYTSRIKQDADLQGLHFAPPIIQQAVELGIDIRITVVGEQVFAATVSSKEDVSRPHVRDFRASNDDPERKIEAIALPDRVARQCVAVVKALGLHFGAIDMIRDKRGEYWFLENNPNGQWAFVELATGQPIGKAIAALLTAPRQG